MSKIGISFTENIDGLKIFHPEVKFVCRMAGVDFVKAKTILLNKELFYKAELFLNDHVGVDEEIRKILDEIVEMGRDVYLYEISSDQDWETTILSKDQQISRSTLINILDEATGKYT